MKVVVTGTRGIPDILGGVETHCEELFPRISDLGIDVTVIRRSCYVSPENRRDRYKGVSLVDVYAPRRKSLEAIVHTFLAIVKARRLNADIVHIHAIGPSLMAPLARLLGMKVVTTHHGPDYDRKKWGFLAKTMLKAGEWCGAHFSNEVIVIS
ncbi:MAG: glycosyltransferase family 4 protein, partial [Candidatus Limisoma sp.]